MKLSAIKLWLILIIFSIIQFGFHNSITFAQGKSGRYTVVIHGGAGTISKNLPDSVKKAYTDALAHALKIGQDILADGGKSIDAVEAVIQYFETDPKFNSGIGAVFTADGTHELDACVMLGEDLSTGAVAGVKHIAHPIKLAKMVMENTRHVLFAGEGADLLGKEFGLKWVDNNYFDTPHRKASWEKWKEKMDKEKHGTVGCVCIDQYGNIAAGTSTGGLTGKIPGRVGDSPIVGAGTYANNRTCGISGTGTGEIFIKNNIAFNISALMEYKGMTLQQAEDEMIQNRLQPGDGGVIGVDKDGNFAFSFNTEGMFRGVATSAGTFEVKIWE
ncbi:MAG TPA: isoaspartyl peptidase/L-asparaginase [Ignavibacteriaceae bacterium]|nr:isoaspartyl peptidase/L-asparaginase [Ignavibacteriaceae bacterium]